MKTFSEVIESIKKLKVISTDNEVAETLGLKHKTFASRKRRNSIPFEELISFCQKEKIHLEDLLGEGSGKGGQSIEHAAGDDQKILDIVRILKSDPSARELVYEILQQDKASSRVANTVKRFLARRMDFALHSPAEGGNSDPEGI